MQRCSYFANGVLEVTQGEMFSDGVSGQAVISRELAELNKSGKCVVIVTHSNELANEADVVFRLRKGELQGK